MVDYEENMKNMKIAFIRRSIDKFLQHKRIRKQHRTELVSDINMRNIFFSYIKF